MKIRLSLFFVLFASACAGQGIDNKYVFLDSFPGRFSSVSVDNFGCFYALEDSRISKFDRDGKFLQSFEEVKLGKTGSIDVTNPMKLTVYYPDFMTVVVLDKFMTFITSYKFFDLGYQTVTAVGSSSDGFLWFYDYGTFTLKKIDETGNVQMESQPVNQLINKVINPNFIMEKNGQVYVNDSATGILVFDNFGGYYKTIPIHGLQRFQLLQDQIIYFAEGKLKSYNTMTFDEKMITLPETAGVKDAVIEKSRIGVQTRDRVDFYKY
jgi:hypothetical protein